MDPSFASMLKTSSVMREAWDLSQGTKPNWTTSLTKCRPTASCLWFISKSCEVSCKSCKGKHRRNGREGSCPIEPIYIREVLHFG
ncbi:hypothetical protein H5410_060087 [Solanum commersonii]|uniref:Uncharacterized protein n=1 Tax=Solanum commersonii TaxID=4109 RepID=A0A9J5W4H1_SOLCO|nr:hypothetical protein H5410_060087 [Solanum commersonii]